MLNRRTLLAFAAASVLSISAASAQSWKAQYSELVFAAIPSENGSGVTDRWSPFIDYLSKTLGTKVTLRIANDYAAVIEGQRAANIHFAYYGPASYSRAVITGVETEPLVVARHDTGVAGYYSVIYVRADSPYKDIADLKGKAIALVDPNSTSGNNAPRFFLNRAGYNVDTFFGKNFFAGSHENAVLALAQGTADAAANFWNSDNDSNLTRMLAKGIVKDADGKSLKKEDFRIVFKSDFLPESPIAALTSLPADLKAALKQALLDMPKKDKAAFDKLSDGKDIEFIPISKHDYEPIIAMLKFNDQARKAPK
jgi:phosphonate transport system substrate-binding protein